MKRPASRSWATRRGTEPGQIASASASHFHSASLRSIGASQICYTLSCARARFRQYFCAPISIRQMSEETPPSSGTHLSLSPDASRPMRPSTAPISPSVSGLARGVDPRIANNQSSWKMVACHYNSTGGIWAAVTSALCEALAEDSLSDLRPN